ANEVLRDLCLRSDDERDDGFDLAGEAALDAGGHAVLHDVDRGQWRGIVAVRLGQDRFARFAENDAARQRVAFDIELRAAAAAAFRLRGKLFGDIEQDRGWDDFVDEAHTFGAFSVERFAVEDDVQRAGKADQARQLGGAAPGGEDAQFRLRQSDL